MPKKVEEALKRRAKQKGYEQGSPQWRAYVYGTLAKIKESKNARRTD